MARDLGLDPQPHCERNEKPPTTGVDTLAAAIDAGTLSAEALVARYCKQLYARTNSYVEVARLTELDRRTVKKHVESSR